ncbi:MAG: MgPME-cyclase complex family protein [Pseudanabaena sp.]
MSEPKQYYFVAASRKYLCEDEGKPLGETLAERRRNFEARNLEVNFWLIEQPAFLEAPELASIKKQIPQPAAAIVTTDPNTMRWLKLRLEFVAAAEFTAPSDSIPNPLASLVIA